MSKETGGAKKYGPANNPYEFTMRNYLAYLKPASKLQTFCSPKQIRIVGKTRKSTIVRIFSIVALLDL